MNKDRISVQIGYDNAFRFTSALSCIVPELQRYLLPFTLPPTSCTTNSPRQSGSMKKKKKKKKKEAQSKNPCKLIATTTPQATSSKNKLGRLYNPGRPLAMEERQKILQLYKNGHRISHIARIIGVTHSCVSKIMTRYRQTGSMQPCTTYSSKKRNINCNGDINVGLVSDNNYQKLHRSCTVDAALSGTSRPVKSYLIQRDEIH
ncbi:unnamed protein product [Onchocerca ochengi]|uniref:Paired domain-containing protein n=1 Tax=Onchocerca ochengi TaxID=42157 RepID=A0A182DZ04_ONCOC|nr:unnamed protein product [Onchocerca ochengi]